MTQTDPKGSPLRAFAPAKINLTLHVTGQRADGYHLLDSFVVFADLGDHLALTPGPDLSLNVTGPFAKGVPTDDRNLVWRAAVLAGWTGDIHLDKHLPHGGGIGGGSSDAAATLRALGAPQDASTLGADVPVCLAAKATRMSGIGEDLTSVTQAPQWAAVLVNPGVHVPTPRVFQALQNKTQAPMTDPPTGGGSDDQWLAWLRQQRNDLETPAIALCPVIQQVKEALSACPGAALVRMSGSGSTCFALFDSHALAATAAARLTQAHPNWWCVHTTLNPRLS